jgi:hypothetical protein
MNPEKKAKELFETFYFATDEDGYHSANVYRAKLQSTLCCDEILKLFINEFKWDEKHNGNIHYWQEVREEIESKKLPV